MSTDNPSKSSNVMSYVFIIFVVGAILSAAYSFDTMPVTDASGATVIKTKMDMVAIASFEATKEAVALAIKLIGIMALWLGMFRILEVGGLLTTVARMLKPILSRLFPDVPSEHPAMGAMIMNISSNMLGLGNAATPFGLKAMQELNKLNPFKGTATNAMIMFLAINTSNVALLPLGMIQLRGAIGSANPAGIFLPSLLSTMCSTIVAITLALFLAKRDRTYAELYKHNMEEQLNGTMAETDTENKTIEEMAKVDNSKFLIPTGKISKFISIAFIVALFTALLIHLVVQFNFFGSFWLMNIVTWIVGESILATTSNYKIGDGWLMPSLMLLIISYACYNGVKIYETVVDGAKQGFEIAVRIIPFLVVILVAVGMFRASGMMDWCTTILSSPIAFCNEWLSGKGLCFAIPSITEYIGLPADVIPMAILRPLSGQGAFVIVSDLTNIAPNSYNAFLSAVINGSTETTFYVLAVYFGSVGIVRIRHAVIAALASDIAGVIFACFFSKMFYN